MPDDLANQVFSSSASAAVPDGPVWHRVGFSWRDGQKSSGGEPPDRVLSLPFDWRCAGRDLQFAAGAEDFSYCVRAAAGADFRCLHATPPPSGNACKYLGPAEGLAASA